MSTNNTAISTVNLSALDSKVVLAGITGKECKTISAKVIDLINRTVNDNLSKTKELALLLSDITPEMVKENGYKALADFAEDKFSIKKSLAYQLAKAGRLYKNPDLTNEVKTLSPSKIVELAPLADSANVPAGMRQAYLDKVNEAAKNGTLTSMTQAALRDFAKSNVVSTSNGKGDKPVLAKEYALQVVKGTAFSDESATDGACAVYVTKFSTTHIEATADLNSVPFLTKDEVKDLMVNSLLYKGAKQPDGEYDYLYASYESGEMAILRLIPKSTITAKLKEEQTKLSKKVEPAADIKSLSMEDLLKALSKEQLAALAGLANASNDA